MLLISVFLFLKQMLYPSLCCPVGDKVSFSGTVQLFIGNSLLRLIQFKPLDIEDLGAFFLILDVVLVHCSVKHFLWLERKRNYKLKRKQKQKQKENKGNF